MSYQYKKSTILSELEQAIKKKVDKSKPKDSNKILQSSIERKRSLKQSHEKYSQKQKELKGE
jgi:hypothetical protein